MIVKRITCVVVTIAVATGSALAQAKVVDKPAPRVPMVPMPAHALADASIAMNPVWSYEVSIPGTASEKPEKAVAFHYEVTAPRDAASGMATGKRMHKPITIVKEFGATASLFQRAMSSGAPIALVIIDATGPGGARHTMKLTNVRVLSFQEVNGPTHDVRYGQVEMTFDRVEMDAKVNKTSAADDWYR